MAEKRKLLPGWLPIVGGPYDGSKYFPPNEPMPGKPVFLGLAPESGPTPSTPYFISADCKSVIYKERK